MKEVKTKKQIRPIKRLFDIIFSIIILVLAFPFILIALISIKIEQICRGRFTDPFFYSETRMSYGEEFKLYKFNIFKYEQILQARESGEFIHTKTLEHNGGITKIGWVLKQIYMDELPQFFTVLKGDLSIIGPRPVNIEVHEKLMVLGILDKNRVPGGITGSYQSHKETTGANSHALDKEYADYYHTQPWYKFLYFDIKIILRTMKVILMARGV
jgi:lipopolysaccharide/colanic/teichoic acid biosynthesis glycosyltransferase